MLAGLAVVILIVALAVLPFFVLTPRAPRPNGSIRSVGDLDAYLQSLTTHGTPPAIEVVVMKDGATVYAKAFGAADAPAGKAAAAGDVYHYWSVTKLFTATAIMLLADDGRLSLDDKVTSYLPDFAATAPSGASAEITIRQLLTHTAGMKDLAPTDLLGWIHHHGEEPVDQVRLVSERLARYRKLAAAPGTVSAYSNAGYIVLSAVVQAVAGVPYEDFVRSRILTPLGMATTDFVYRADLLARATAGSHPLFHFYTPLLLAIHRDWFSAWVSAIKKQRMWLRPLYTDYTGPTGLIGTAQDLVRFGQAFLDGGNGVLKPATVARMLGDDYGGPTGPDKDRMGLGWHWWNDAPIPFKGHGGAGPGFGAQLAIFPEQRVVIVLLANDTLIDRLGLTNIIAGVFA
jgi:CubicO group peptidase (beta-lactamase class C family)